MPAEESLESSRGNDYEPQTYRLSKNYLSSRWLETDAKRLNTFEKSVLKINKSNLSLKPVKFKMREEPSALRFKKNVYFKPSVLVEEPIEKYHEMKSTLYSNESNKIPLLIKSRLFAKKSVVHRGAISLDFGPH